MLERTALDPVSPEALALFAEVIQRRFGLGKAARNGAVLERRLRELMRACGRDLQPPGVFVAQLAGAADGSPLLREAAGVVANHETWFFRDREQLAAITGSLVPELARGGTGPLRILSMGCSTGEELYSLAMLLLEELHRLWGRELELVGADLSPRVIEVARSGWYPARALARAERGPQGWAQRYFRSEPDESAGIAARGLLRQLAELTQANLQAPRTLAPLGTFDLVVCRNVLIYFEGEVLERAEKALSGLVRPGGALVLGRAETGAASIPEMKLLPVGEHLWVFRKELA